MPCLKCITALDEAASYVRELAIFRADIIPSAEGHALAERLIDLAGAVRQARLRDLKENPSEKVAV